MVDGWAFISTPVFTLCTYMQTTFSPSPPVPQVEEVSFLPGSTDRQSAQPWRSSEKILDPAADLSLMDILPHLTKLKISFVLLPSHLEQVRSLDPYLLYLLACLCHSLETAYLRL